MTPLETIQSLYDAFARGDLPFMVGLFGETATLEAWPDNTAVESGQVPYLKRQEGPAGAAEFFASLACAEVRAFAVNGYIASGDEVAVKISIELLIKATGKI